MGELTEVSDQSNPVKNIKDINKKNASPFVSMGANAVYGAKEYGFRLYEISLG